MTRRAFTHPNILSAITLILVALAMLSVLSAQAQRSDTGYPNVRLSEMLAPQQTAAPLRFWASLPELAYLSSHVKTEKADPAVPASESPTFLPAALYDSGGYLPWSLAVADVNGDGIPDLIAANGSLSLDAPYIGSVSVLLGNGDGTFLPPIFYETIGANQNGPNSSSLAVGDVNGDGNLDLIVATWCLSFNSCSSGGVNVLLGNGDGTFQPAVAYASGASGATSVAIADVNGDGKPDLLIANACTGNCNPGEGGVSVLLGNGDGSFQTPVTYDSGGIGATSLVTADLNNDGKIDLVVTNCGCLNAKFYSSGSVAVLLGNGNGTFQAAVSYPAGATPWEVAVADLNGDGNLDLAVADSGDSSVAVLLGTGNGTFLPATTYDSGGVGVDSVAIADVNGDGVPDLLAGNHCTNQACNTVGVAGVLLGNGDGTFQAPIAFQAGDNWTDSIVGADVNGDGMPDLLLLNEGNSTASVLLNNIGLSKTSTTTTLTSSVNPSAFGQAVILTANVSSAAGIPPNSETVTFHSGSSIIGTSPLNNGTASLTTSSLSAGAPMLTANYSGDTNFGPSASPSLQQIVTSHTKFTTSAYLTPNPVPLIYGQSVTFIATVSSPGIATGEVAFMWSGYSLGSGTLDSKGVATLTRSNMNADTYPLTAVYRGDANNLSSTSGIMTLVIGQTTSSATLTSSPNPSNVGQSVTFTAKILSPTVRAKGPVTFTAGNTVLGTAQLGWNGEATLSISSLAAGSTTVTATYDGDSNIKGSSASVTQVVQ
jgi:hypothetical protein